MGVHLIEAEVVAAFGSWLVGQGWSVRIQVEHVDLVAERDGIMPIAEVKGVTSSAGTDLDTCYGQLLRRMTPNCGNRRYALVVPANLRKSAERVPRKIRELLKIDLYLIADDGSVEAT